ncbi:hypothetical protein AUC70_11825 [Methyloceanibacter stevinii]|uniref:Uncharacterized protein n=2 Tax=Methyloceanibacter stevinii TaxID=1774970 RepID=A0A1E3VJ53_9HYPH|nr:hypothetical protein AUC70_11825 [Methyloceanibacter stevinii]
MARRTNRRLRKRPVEVTSEVRGHLLAIIEDEHDDRLSRGYVLRSIGLWMNPRGDYTVRYVYRGDGKALDSLTHVIRGRA